MSTQTMLPETAQPTPAPAGGMHAGLGTLLRLALQRDRWRLPLIVLGVAAFELLMAGSLISTYATKAERQGYLETIDNPGSIFLLGAPYHGHDYNHGVMIGHQTLVWVCTLTAILAVLTVVRHTRAEEEAGRTELLRAAQVGTHTPLLAGFAVATLQVVAIGAAVVLSLITLGAADVDTAGAITYGAAVAATGLAFAGVAALTAQLVDTGRAAGALATMVLAASFLVRGAGDVGDSFLGWLSPFGWAQRTFPWDTNRLAPLGLSLLLALVCFFAAVALVRRRDIGAAIWSARPGRTSASAGLTTGFGLAMRLNRANLIGWAIGLGIFGVVYGPVLKDAEKFLRDMPVLEDFLPEAVVAGGVQFFTSVVVALGALAAAIPATQVLTRFVRDENAGRTTALLAGPRSRLGWYAANVACALVIGTVAVIAFGAGFGFAAARAVDDSAMFGDVLRASIAYLPAIAVIIGLAGLLAGWLPKRAGLVWLLLVYAVVIFYFAKLMDWPETFAWFSPYDHIAPRPALSGDGAERLWLSVIALVLIGFGAVGYRRRPIG